MSVRSSFDSIGNIFAKAQQFATPFDNLFSLGGDRLNEDGMSQENYNYGRLNGSGANQQSDTSKNTPTGFVTQNSGSIGSASSNAAITMAMLLVVAALAYMFFKRK